MNRIKTICLSLLIAVSLMGSCLIALAADTDTDKDKDKDKEPDFIMDTSQIGESNNGTIRSEQLLELGSLTSGGLSLEGEQALRQGSLDRALTVMQRSVEMAPMDVDARILYAQTLQKKLMMQRDKKDPVLYNFLIKQWFFVFQKSDFLDEKMQGFSHLKDLTGTLPKRFEKPQKYLARVLIPEDGSVKVKIGGANPTNTKKLASKKNSDLDDELMKKDNIY